MGIFCVKNLEKSELVCHQIKKMRERKKITLEKASDDTMISIKYLTAIEECRFCDLPQASVHKKAYIKKYGIYLGLNEKNLLNKFNIEENKQSKTSEEDNKHPQNKIKKIKIESVSIWIRNILTGLFVILFITYAIWQVQGILQPPKLVVYNPPEGFVTTLINITVEGKTDKENKVTVNGEDIMVDNEGHFSGQIDLSKGINTINIVASKKHGKTTTVIRNIIVQK